uniref:Secreted protein n=1 Tax=Rousettus aegyptiacus TaxID=9407 RepID=A0A7J8FII4_ROUAE|nr:hypothetical protein HJG63_011990 [Rousettus aegyptiacus]
MHTHPSISTNALFFLLLLQTTAGKKIKHQPQPSATRKYVASDCDCCKENGKGLLFQRQPRTSAIATSEKCTIARSFPRTEQNLEGPDQESRRQPLLSAHASRQHHHAFKDEKSFTTARDSE